MRNILIQSWRMAETLLHHLKKSPVSSEHYSLLPPASAWREARKENTTTDDALETAQTARRTMATAMAAGTMVTTTNMDVSLEAIEAAAKPTK